MGKRGGGVQKLLKGGKDCGRERKKRPQAEMRNAKSREANARSFAPTKSGLRMTGGGGAVRMPWNDIMARTG